MAKSKKEEESKPKCSITVTEYVELRIPDGTSDFGTSYQLVEPTTQDIHDFLHAVWTKFGPMAHKVTVNNRGLAVVRARDYG